MAKQKVGDLSPEERAILARLQLRAELFLKYMAEGDEASVGMVGSCLEGLEEWSDRFRAKDPKEEFRRWVENSTRKTFLLPMLSHLEELDIVWAHVWAGELMKFFEVVADELGVELPPPEEEGAEEEVPTGEALTEEDRLAMPIEDLGLSSRVHGRLRAGSDISTVGEVLEMLARGDEELLAVRNFGSKALAELKERLVACGFELPGQETGEEIPGFELPPQRLHEEIPLSGLELQQTVGEED